MSAAFELAIEHVLRAEGGYSKHPADKGGPTNFGITQATLADFRKQAVSAEDVKNLTREEAIAIYKAKYWDPMGLERLTGYGAVLALFDQGVNRGRKTAIIQAQTVFNSFTPGTKLLVDGVLGPKTAGAINAVEPIIFAREYTQFSQSAYNDIVLRNNSQLVFLKGWTNRVHRLQDAIIGGNVLPFPTEHVPAPRPDNIEHSNLGPFEWAKRELGQAEIAGSKHNPRIVWYHGFTSLKATTDETPWCASFVCAALEVNGIKSTKSAAAGSYKTWGVPGDGSVGDVIVVKRTGGHHVGFLAAPWKTGDAYAMILGGNQSNRVSIAKDKREVLAVRKAA